MTSRNTLLSDLLLGDRVVWIVYMLLCFLSLIEVFSAASSLSFGTGNYLEPITKHSTMLMLGVVVVFATHRIPIKYFRLIPFVFLPVACVLLLTVMIMGIMSDNRINGAARWLFGFQPSEIAKMAVVAAVAYILAKFQQEDECSPLAFKPILIVTGVVLALIAPENASTALLLGSVVFVMMIIGRVPWKQIFKLVGACTLVGGMFLAFIIYVPPTAYKNVPGTHRFVTWRNRVLEFFNKEEVPAAKFDIDSKAQIAHANIAIATSHIFGKGPGNSVQRDHLSHGYSDFIYAIILEELGLIGGAATLFLYLVLLFRGGKIAMKCDKQFPSFLVMGVTLLLVFQALLHMMVSVGLFPVTGQPLPLVSKGGTSILFNCFYIGMILSVSRAMEDGNVQEMQEAAPPLMLEEKNVK